MRLVFFFFFKQKTAYEIGTGDWSSDVCSSDLGNSNEVTNSFTAVKKSVIAKVSSKARSTSSREALERHIGSEGGRCNIQLENLPNSDHIKRSNSDGSHLKKRPLFSVMLFSGARKMPIFAG